MKTFIRALSVALVFPVTLGLMTLLMPSLVHADDGCRGNLLCGLNRRLDELERKLDELGQTVNVLTVAARNLETWQAIKNQADPEQDRRLSMLETRVATTPVVTLIPPVTIVPPTPTGTPVPSSTSLLISEVLADSSSPGTDTVSETVEIYNPTDWEFDLGRWQIGDSRSPGEDNWDDLGGIVLPHSYFLIIPNLDAFRAQFGEPQAPFFELPDGKIGDNGLSNGSDRVVLRHDGTEVDCVGWGTEAAGKACFDPAVKAAAAGKSLQRVPPEQDTNMAADWKSGDPTPGR